MNLRTLGLTKILLTFIILSIIGALMIYSASSYDLLMQGVKPTAVFIKQGIIMCLSCANVRDLQSSTRSVI